MERGLDPSRWDASGWSQEPNRNCIPSRHSAAGSRPLQLRTLQTMAEIAKNSTIIFPSQFMTTVQEAIAMLNKDSASK